MFVTLQILVGLALLVVGGELLVRGAASLAAAMKISPLVVGLTVVAFGTSAPELGVSLQAAAAGSSAVAVGNVLGSNIINVLFVLGAASVVAPLIVSSTLVRKDVPIMIVASIVVWWMASDGVVNRIEGLTLFVSLLIYLTHSIVVSRRENKASAEEFEEFASAKMRVRDYLIQVTFLIGGLALLGIGANQLVSGATAVATALKVSDLVIGLTVVAIGTSLPEVVTSVVASYRGQRDIAVGNVVGSNLFNLLCVLALTAAIAPGGVPVTASSIQFDFPVLVGVALVCFPIFLTGHAISRGEGIWFLLLYGLYTFVLLAVASNPALAGRYGMFVRYGVVPLATLTFVGSLLLSWMGKTGPNVSPETDHVDQS